MKPEAAIASWQQWHCDLAEKPVIVERLAGGLSNQSFLLDSGNYRMVLRINHQDTLLPGANRDVEAKIWRAASARGIAPPLLCVDERAGFMVSEYIETSLPPRPQTVDRVLDQVFELMTQCHGLDVNAPTLDYAGHIQRYWDMIEKREVSPAGSLVRQREPMLGLLESLLAEAPRQGLCHHDPVRANFVGTTDRLYLIDWEFATRGLLVLDYAALGIEWGLNDAVVVERAGVEPETLVMAKALYGYFCALWGALATDWR